MTTLADQTVFPPSANEAVDLHGLAQLLTSDQRPLLVGADGVEHQLPPEVWHLLSVAIKALAEGEAVTVAPRNTVLTTSEAAEVLGVTRPTLVKLLETGQISFTKPGEHRRVRLADLLDYQRHLRRTRRSALAAMTKDAADDDSYRTVNTFTETR